MREQKIIWNLAWYWLPPLAWMALIFYLSAQPELPSPPQPLLNTLFEKGGHFVVYALLAWWWWRALTRGGKTTWTGLGLALVISVLYGVSDEFHQSFVPGRTPSLLDLVFDAVGAAAAGLINPLVAAILMPLSSAMVIWGASRVEVSLESGSGPSTRHVPREGEERK